MDDSYYKKLFIDLFRAVGACEAPEGTQVDDVLEEFQAEFDKADPPAAARRQASGSL